MRTAGDASKVVAGSVQSAAPSDWKLGRQTSRFKKNLTTILPKMKPITKKKTLWSSFSTRSGSRGLEVEGPLNLRRSKEKKNWKKIRAEIGFD